MTKDNKILKVRRVEVNNWINGLCYKVDLFDDALISSDGWVVYVDLINLTPYLACDINQEVELILLYDDLQATSLIKS